MLQEPHVRVLAQQMQSSIDEALAAEPLPRLEPAPAGPSRHAVEPYAAAH
jgi:hypothetical protein